VIATEGPAALPLEARNDSDMGMVYDDGELVE
jgi:hypothetical protein